MSETTLDKIQGARELTDMFRWTGMTQREIQKLEDFMGNALNDTRNRVTGVSHDLAATRKAATNAGIALWRHGPADLAAREACDQLLAAQRGSRRADAGQPRSGSGRLRRIQWWAAGEAICCCVRLRGQIDKEGQWVSAGTT